MPLQPGKDGGQQNPIRLKNLIRVAEVQLEAGGWREPEIRALLAPAWGFTQERSFWQGPRGGLAVFVAPGIFEYMFTPVSFEERVTVGAAFVLKPLLPLLEEREFHILAVSRKGARLLKADPFGLTEVPVPALTRTMDEVLGLDVQGRQLLQRPTGQRGAGARGSVHYGFGAEERDEKAELLQYFRYIDRAVQEPLAGRRTPLVLACVGYQAPIYREANTYPYLADKGVAGSPDDLTAEELQGRAWAVAEPYFDSARALALAKFRELEGTGRTAVEIAEILPAVKQGRVECLFMNATASGDEMLEQAILQTFLTGGTVHLVPSGAMPGKQAVAAILRY
jgi:hypothetical protein